jgi:serine phosphatase RsbU (regulator of sigma subunit)/PAS domain-containing protein/anti-sigma regulatory factor (Ser/Thr protein kinase)
MAAPIMHEPTLGSPFSVATTAMAVIDPRGLVIGWNHAAQELLGFSPEEVLGKPARKFFVPLDGLPLIGPDLPLECWGETRTLRHRAGHPVRAALYVPALGPREASVAWVIVAISADEMDRWNQDQAMLAGLFTETPVELAVYSPEGRILWVNKAAERLGDSPDFWIGRYPRDITRDSLPGGEIISPELHDRSFEDIIDEVFRTGEPVIDLHYRGPTAMDPIHHRVWSCSYFRLQDARGRLLGVCESAFDITARYEAQQRLALLCRSNTLGTSLDVTRTAEELVEVTVPDFADAVRVELAEPVLTGGDIGTGHTDLPPLRLAAESSQLAAGSEVQWPPPKATVGAQQVVLPLRIGEVVLGQVIFTRVPPQDPFSGADLALAEEIVSHAAVCLDNARRYAHQRATALLLQRDLLPAALAVPAAVQVAHLYAPTSGPRGVGGDWYDVIPLSGARVGLVVGDVVGHGLHAAATMGRLRTSVRALAGLDLTPEDLLSRLDDLVAQSGIGAKPDTDLADDLAIGTRCLYAVYDPVTRRCSIASAGHLPPLLVEEGGTAVALDIPVGLPLGIGGLPYESAEFEIAENSLLVLFTDGLVMRKNVRDAEAGMAELCRTLSRHPALSPDAARNLIATWHAGDPAQDDAVLLIARVRGLQEDQMASHPVYGDLTEVAAARSWTLDCLTAWGLDDLSFVAELVVSELVTNAIRYGRPPVLLRLLREQDRGLICEVSDGGHTSPHLRRAGPDDEGGRGLFLVAQLTDRWGTRYTRGGKTIWTEVPTVAA